MSPQLRTAEAPPSYDDPQRAALIAEMQSRVAPPPERGFLDLDDKFDPDDPALDVAACLRLGIPPRPEDPAALALWRQAVTPPLRMVAFGPDDVSLRRDIGHGLSSISRAFSDPTDDGQEAAGAVITGGGRLSNSGNWSGAAIIPHSGERFIQVLARWSVPKVQPGEGEGPWVCSTWIGLDGLRRWMGSMPQMGTTQSVGDIGTADPAYFAWYQWWLRGHGVQVPVPLPVAVKPGDTVYCVVTRLPRGQPAAGNEHQVQFFLRVNGVATCPIVMAPPSDAPDAKVASRGGSAQWILERPTALADTPNKIVREGDLFPLPDFGTAGITDFAATMAHTPDHSGITNSLTVAAPALDPGRKLHMPRLLRMVRALSDPPRTEVIAKPHLAPDGGLTVHYRG
jgi:hypothetical protein